MEQRARPERRELLAQLARRELIGAERSSRTPATIRMTRFTSRILLTLRSRRTLVRRRLMATPRIGLRWRKRERRVRLAPQELELRAQRELPVRREQRVRRVQPARLVLLDRQERMD